MIRWLRWCGGAVTACLLIGLSSEVSACHRQAYLVAYYAADKGPGYVKMNVPADAVVEVDGFKTMQTGAVRLFVTPELEKGKKYSYQIKATFSQNGKQVTVERTISVETGVETVVDLTKTKLAKKEEPKKVDEPKKKEELKKVDEPRKKEEPKKVDEPKKKDEPKKVDEPKKEVKLDVPYVPTPEPVVEAMLKLAGVSDRDVVYDLGCGDGRIVITAVKKYKAKKGLGIELAPERVKLSKENARKAGVDGKIEIREGSVLELKDVSEASVVTLYLLPDVNLKLMPILKKLKPGSRIVSHDFDMGDWKAEKEITVKDEDGREHTIYLWTIPEARKKPAEKKPAPPAKDTELGPMPRVKDKAKTPTTSINEVLNVEPRAQKEPKKEEKTIVVPYVPTPQKVVDAMLKLAAVKEGDVVYDLGCGDGRIVITAVKDHKAKEGWGLDLNPERVKESQENAKKAGVADKLKFEQGDVLKIQDVSKANVVTLYLLPEVNRRLAPMLLKTLKPGSRVVSHDFDMGDWKPEKKIAVTDADGVDHVVYLWIIPARK